ncbi:hypothetical protein B0J17DRAFT_672337, partial [Rhizoctonia solani]
MTSLILFYSLGAESGLQAYLSIFSKPKARKKGLPANEAVPVPPAKRCRGNGNLVEVANAQPSKENLLDGNTEIDNLEGPVDDIDEDKAEYNNVIVKASVAAAFSDVLTL